MLQIKIIKVTASQAVEISVLGPQGWPLALQRRPGLLARLRFCSGLGSRGNRVARGTFRRWAFLDTTGVGLRPIGQHL
jgi:hypothetical protein